MMQLIAINDPAAVDINKKMSTLGQSLETNNLTMDTENYSNNGSQNENTTPTNVNIKNETINGMNKASLNINGILKINRAEIDDKTGNDQAVVGNEIEINGQTNEPNVDCKFSADDINNSEKNLEDKEEIIPTNDLKITETKNIVDEVSSETPALQETMKTGVNTPTDVDILMGDNVTASQISTFSPNSDADEKKNYISPQQQQLENDVSIDGASRKSSIIKEINKEIVQEATSGDISLNRTEENKADSLLKNGANDELVANETEQIVLPCRDSPIINAKNNGISQVSTENESIVDEVLDDAPVISDNISHKVDDVIIDQPSVEEASNLPIEELSKDTNQKETMDIDDEKIDPPSRDGLKLNKNTQNNGISEITSENESMVDNILDEAPIINANISADIIDKENVEEASDLPLESHFEETYQKETIDIDAANKTNNAIKVDENDEILKSHLIDVDDTVVCTLEKYPNAEETMSENHDSIKNSNEDKNDAEKDVEPAGPSEQTKTKTTEADSEIPSEVVKLNQYDTVAMDIDDTKEMSLEKSALSTDVDTNETNIETKADEALAEKLDATEQRQKVNIDMDIDDVEKFSTVVSTLGSDDDTKESNTESKTNEEVPTEQDPMVCVTDKNELNLKESNLTNSEVKGDESSEVISIDECENDTGRDRPVISFCSVAPVETKEKPSLIIPEKKNPVVCKLSNTMDILSDDEDEPPAKSIESKTDKVDEEPKKAAEENKCINLDDDDDIMFIENTNSQEPKLEHNEGQLKPEFENTNDKTNFDIENENSTAKSEEEAPHIVEEGKPTTDEAVCQPKEDGTIPTKTSEDTKPIITKTFLQSVTKNLADMTRNELEDFCILKLVESVVDKSNLNEIKSKMKTLTQTLEDLRKKTVTLTKQNRDLQVVVKTIQEDQRKRTTNPMMPMKITRSVGMQVVLTGEKSLQKRKPITPTQPPPPMTPARPARTSQSPKNQQKPQANIPVPRLVPASSPTLKPPAAPVTSTKVTVRNATPQRPEKRPHNKITPPAASSVTVDLTDDEPPSKIPPKNPTPPVRLVPSQNLMPKNRPQFTPNTSNNSARESPRKVYIPISSNNPRPAVAKNFAPTPRSRPPVIHPSVVRMQTVRVNQVPTSNRHPAPLPDAMKQYQPPAWKALPPAPDLKLSKVDNGIVISWKFEGYQPDSYEEVASFQLYAYQETNSPPSTALWKKIGDIKALPLPMACTLTQFMSGFKYYFAVRAIDVRSRIGPFSLPGSIMLISKT